MAVLVAASTGCASAPLLSRDLNRPLVIATLPEGRAAYRQLVADADVPARQVRRSLRATKVARHAFFVHRYEEGYSRPFERLLDDAIRDWGQNYEARVLRGAYLALNHRPREALRVTEEVVDELEALAEDRLGPRRDLYAAAVLNATLYLVTLERFPEAWLSLQRFSVREVERPTAVQRLHRQVAAWLETRIAVATGRPEAARELLGRLEGLPADCPGCDDSLERYRTFYPRYLGRQSFEAARLYTYGLLAVREGSLELALMRFEAALEVDPSLLEAELGLATTWYLCALREQGCRGTPGDRDRLFAEAERRFHRVARQADRGLLYQPQNVYFDLGNLFLSRARLASAGDPLTADWLAAAESNYCRALSQELEVGSKGERCGPSLCAGLPGEEIAPRGWILDDAFNNLGLVYEARGGVPHAGPEVAEVAADCLRRAAEVADPSDRLRPLVNLARVLRSAGSDREFLEAARQVLDLEPQHLGTRRELESFIDGAGPVAADEARRILAEHPVG